MESTQPEDPQARRGLAPRLPPELCDMVLSESLPRNAWNFRRVCRRWNSYVLGTLAPKRWLPRTSIFVRGPQSWIFFRAARGVFDDDLPSNTTGSQSWGPNEGGCREILPPTVLTSTRFECTRLVGVDVAQFEPAAAPLHPWHLRELIMKLEDEVQVLFRLPTAETGVETFKHAVVNSLALAERTKPTLTLRWRELFTRTIASSSLEEDLISFERRTLLGDDSPSVLWVADGEDGCPGRWFSARNIVRTSPEGERLTSSRIRESWRCRRRCKGEGRSVMQDEEDEDLVGSDGYDADVENEGPPSDSEIFDGPISD
ncbi:hypothetical protein FRC04_000733 [Tulasnella sp. 424]|nr:hypothetical protein FRC04_000733 [Tulasnella sp. 424]KAG8968577.1 hypothetical protein FRC05_001502 [Tulasnella sp. 425]